MASFSGSAVLEIRDLTIRYDRRTILDRVSLRVERAERIAFLGSSGAGKTTLFRAVNGFVPAASGTIRLNGTDITRLRGRDLRSVRAHIGVVSQRHDLIEELSVSQNV